MAQDLQRRALAKLCCPWVQGVLIVMTGLVALGFGLGLSSAPEPPRASGCEQDSSLEDAGYAQALGRAGCR